jgi:hypothetical protein
MRILFRVSMLMSLLVACKSNKPQSPPPGKDFKIVRLDSINNVYLIYARQKDTLYKIVSLKEDGRTGKENVHAGRSIVVDSSYRLDLVSLFIRNFQGYDLSPKNSMDLGGISYSGTLIKVERDSIVDLYRAKNVKGLSLIN